MASYRESSLVPGLVGSIGGLSFRNSRCGRILQRRALPAGQATPAQLLSRSQLQAVSSFWKTLTSDQHRAWANAAANYQLPNRVGERFTLNGFQLFMRVNLTGAHVLEPPTGVIPQTLSVTALTAPPFFYQFIGYMMFQVGPTVPTPAANWTAYITSGRTWSTNPSTPITWGTNVEQLAGTPGNSLTGDVATAIAWNFPPPLPPDGEIIGLDIWAKNPDNLPSLHYLIIAPALNVH